MQTTHGHAPLRSGLMPGSMPGSLSGLASDSLPAPLSGLASGSMPDPGSGAMPGPVPGPCEVPDFAPLRVRGTGLRPRLRRVPGALLVTAAAALALTALAGSPGRYDPGPRPASAPAARSPAPVRLVSAPVRIADADAVRLLRAGDRVDVIAAPAVNSPLGGGGSTVRVVARAARVAEVPRPGETRPDGGALIVLTVPRATATALAGAGVTSQLAVTLC
ncbi:hypothetical protein [Streptomyces filamentosus]|uniref:hypothetical protein n=1 Tax=Streptomyces filamentosus TaxID=67294 RepID=UPI001F37F733|nr:hypothetical protein [Streptomyces filamentosus]